MTLKRKRSSELLTLFHSPARSDSSIESLDDPASPTPVFPRAYATPSHLPSRTMKRFRDNRPPEDEVHQRTLNMLFAAQQQQQQQQHQNQQIQIPNHQPPPQHSSSVPASRGTQRSLHSFWNINSAAPALTTSFQTPSVDQDPSSCEDCGVGLGAAGAFECDHACGACGRHVCPHCSITNLGEQRRCLRCTGGSGSAWVAAGGGGSDWPSVRLF